MYSELFFVKIGGIRTLPADCACGPWRASGPEGIVSVSSTN